MNGIGWFQIGVRDAAAAERFYGDLFGWSFSADADEETPYRIVSTPDPRSVQGGVAHGDQVPTHAIFCVVVADVAAVCDRAAETGGEILIKPRATKSGLVMAHLRDPEGNHFGVYQPPAS